LVRHKTTTFLASLVAIAVLFGAIIGGYAYYNSQEIIEATVRDKERVCSSSGEGTSCAYRVYTDTEVFVNKDSLLFRKWNSADVQGQLEAGRSYELTVVGWRIPFFSAFRNIVEVTP
jgi:hypothetical protein